MNIVFTIVSLLALVTFTTNQIIKYQRFKHVLRLKSQYEEIELFFVENNIHLNTRYIDFLKALKNLAINPRYLDIQILLLVKLKAEQVGRLEKDAKWFKNTVASLGKDFEVLFDKFDNEANNIILLSYLRPDFLFFISKIATKYFIKSGVGFVSKLYNDLTYARDNDEVMSYSGMKLAA